MSLQDINEWFSFRIMSITYFSIVQKIMAIIYKKKYLLAVHTNIFQKYLDLILSKKGWKKIYDIFISNDKPKHKTNSEHPLNP